MADSFQWFKLRVNSIVCWFRTLRIGSGAILNSTPLGPLVVLTPRKLCAYRGRFSGCLPAHQRLLYGPHQGP